MTGRVRRDGQAGHAGLAVGVGAVAGAAVRWTMTEAFPDPDGWPWSILVVNVAGSLLLGVVLAATHRRTDDPSLDTVRLAVGTGFCGALTTFSTFAVDVAAFLRDGRSSLGLAYVLVSIVVGVAAFLVGRTMAIRNHGR